ncbi:MAG: NUDIX hydrolase [Gemmatimonadota bacterium]|nr:NUDIX hydrolase [Gemmatimonadota bacterium]
MDVGIFRIFSHRARSPRTGEERKITVVDSNDWVNVVAITPDAEVVLVRQFRHGVEAVTLEIPGGLVDAGEDPAAAGVRELLEETGYAGGEPQLLGRVRPNPSFLTNLCHTFLVEDCIEVAEPSPDPGEDIRVARVPLAELPGLVASGEITHSLVVCAFWLLAQKRPDLLTPGPGA